MKIYSSQKILSSGLSKLLTLACFTVLISLESSATIGAAQMPSNHDVSISLRGVKHSVQLKAFSDAKPTLRLNLKRTVQLEKNLQNLNFSDLAALQKIFLKFGFSELNSFDDFYILSNFAHGFENIHENNIFSKVISENDKAVFWTAIFPKSAKITKTILHRDWFAGGVGGHAQVRFILNSPVLILPKLENIASQTPIDVSQRPLKDQLISKSDLPHLIAGDVVYSLFALRSEGGPDEWNLSTGMGGAFANAYTLTSTLHNSIYLATSDLVEQFELNTSNLNGALALQAAILRADRFKTSHIYHLTLNSCITEIMSLLSLPDIWKPLKSPKFDTIVFNPYTFIEKSIGFIQKKRISLNQEVGAPLHAKAISPIIEKALPIFQSSEFETAAIELSIALAPYSYKELAIIFEVISDTSLSDSDRVKKLNEIPGITPDSNIKIVTLINRYSDLINMLTMLRPRF
jgi:hypothetical protein